MSNVSKSKMMIYHKTDFKRIQRGVNLIILTNNVDLMFYVRSV